MKYLLTIVFLLSINSLSAKVEECVKIKEDTARLDCFDSLFLDIKDIEEANEVIICLLYTSPSPRDKRQSRMPSSA